MNPRSHTRPVRRRCSAFTLVEVLVASSIGVMVAGTTMVLLLASAQEEYRGLADTTVEQEASNLSSRITQCLRMMSASQGVVFDTTQPETEGGAIVGWRRIVVAAGPAPDYPRVELKFNPTTGKVTYNPDCSNAGNAQILFQNNSEAVVRRLYFWPSFRADGRQDNTLVNVLIDIDDNNSSRRNLASSDQNPSSIERSFSVKMRNM